MPRPGTSLKTTIIRKTGVVKITGKIVVELDAERCVKYKDSNIEALVRSDVDDFMKKWLAKIGRE